MTSAATDLHLSEPESHSHPTPSLSSVDRSLRGTYSAAPKGEDVNLLILFHGLGDTCAPFAKLATSLQLPQSATLSLQGVQRVPLLEEEAYQWVDSFDPLGNGASPLLAINVLLELRPPYQLMLQAFEPLPVIPNPNPTETLTLLLELLTHLTSNAPGMPAWRPSSVSLFGFGQGGSIASELSSAWARTRPKEEHLRSLVTVSGPLWSFPTMTNKAHTKALVVLRQGEERMMGVGGFNKGFESVQEAILPRGEGMPRSREEWQEIMRFWSTNLQRRSALEQSGNVYEIRAGQTAPKFS